MDLNSDYVIALSKAKIIRLVVAALVFVALGCWLVQLDAATIEAQRRLNSPWLIHGLGVVAVVFATLCAAVGIKKLSDGQPGVVLSQQGLWDNASGVAAGWIAWSEITGFAVFEVQKQPCLIVMVENPARYLNAGGWLKRLIVKANYRMCGSPITISAHALSVPFDELVALCQQYHLKFGQSAD